MKLKAGNMPEIDPYAQLRRDSWNLADSLCDIAGMPRGPERDRVADRIYKQLIFDAAELAADVAVSLRPATENFQ